MRSISFCILFFLIFPLLTTPATAQSEKVLLFVSYEDTYYSEYVVMKEALEASGYEVEVRSSGSDFASVYMVPENTDIAETAGTLPGGSYEQFQAQFLDLFGSEWNSGLNQLPGQIPLDGSILDVEDMSGYVALVIVGGTGAIDYRVDGSYVSQGAGDRLVSPDIVQQTAEKLNELALDAIRNELPVMAQCHGASLPAFFRIPDTEGEGAEALGVSLLKGQNATGFPEDETGPTLTSLGVNYRASDRVTVSSASDVLDDPSGDFKIITTRDWYPQTVAHAAQTLINSIESYPRIEQREEEVSVLILHGGAINTSNCGAGNRANDVPCNYGTGDNLPADFTHLSALLENNEMDDGFTFSFSDANILDATFPTAAAELETYFEGFDVVIFFKHWSTGMTNELQNALVSYADNGGGVLGLHHGMYNDIDGSRNKDILAHQLFGAESAAATWSANLTNYNLFSTNYGHFVSTYHVEFENSMATPNAWNSNALLASSNASYSYYQQFPIFDEIYNNMAFVEEVEFGREVNQVTPLFSNNLEPSGQSHTSGFVRLFNPSEDNSTGRVAFFEPGERRESINPSHPYGQVIRNAVVWLANNDATGGLFSEPEPDRPEGFQIAGFYPNPFNPNGNIEFNLPQSGYITLNLYNMLGQKVSTVFEGPKSEGSQTVRIDGAGLPSGVYLLRITFGSEVQTIRISLIK